MTAFADWPDRSSMLDELSDVTSGRTAGLSTGHIEKSALQLGAECGRNTAMASLIISSTITTDHRWNVELQNNRDLKNRLNQNLFSVKPDLLKIGKTSN